MPDVLPHHEPAVLFAVLELDTARWRQAAQRADVRLELEEELTRQARARGRELADERRELRTYYRRHRYTETATGRRREWLEQVPASDGGHLVKVVRTAPAYRVRPCHASTPPTAPPA